MQTPSVNVIEFQPVPKVPGRDVSSLGLVFDTIIDGQSYLETLTAFEETQPDSWAKPCIAGLGTAEVMHTLDQHGARIHPFVCDLWDNWDDWDYNCLIEIYNQQVVCWRSWKYYDMTTSRESTSDYTKLPVLTFEYKQYMDAVAQARDLIRKDGSTLHMKNRFWWQYD